MDANIEAEVASIRALADYVSQSREEYEFMPPSLASHVTDYEQDRQRLRRYAGQAIGARVAQFLGTNLMKTHFFLQTYLSGVDSRNPYTSLMAARAQIETLAVVWDVVRILKENGGDHEDKYVDRVKLIDSELILGTYGGRSEVVRGLIRELRLSKLRPNREEDYKLFEARNILTRIDRLSAKDKDYKNCREDYDRLCEYLHPNMAQNIILLVPSRLNDKFQRLSRTDEAVMARALAASAAPMNKAASQTVKILETQLEPPFTAVMTMGLQGPGRTGRVPTINTRAGRNEPCPCGSGLKYKKCCGLAN
jgi:hypothetical protein